MTHTASTFVDKSPQWEVAKPPKTQLELDLEMHKKRAPAGTGPFTTTSLQRDSFVSHAGHKDKVWMEKRAPRYQPRRGGPKRDRKDLTSTGAFQGFTAEEMAAARGTATFTAEHTTAEPPPELRSATFGCNLHYFREGI